MGWQIRTLLIFFLLPLGIFQNRKSLFESPYQINENPWDSITAFVMGREESGGTMALKRQHGGKRACVKTTHPPPLSMCFFMLIGLLHLRAWVSQPRSQSWESVLLLSGDGGAYPYAHTLFGSAPLSVFLLLSCGWEPWFNVFASRIVLIRIWSSVPHYINQRGQVGWMSLLKGCRVAVI